MGKLKLKIAMKNRINHTAIENVFLQTEEEAIERGDYDNDDDASFRDANDFRETQDDQLNHD